MNWSRLTPRVPQVIKERFTPRLLKRAGTAAAAGGAMIALAATGAAGGQAPHSTAPISPDRAPASATTNGHARSLLEPGGISTFQAGGKTFKISLSGDDQPLARGGHAQSERPLARAATVKATPKPTDFASLKKGTTFVDVSKWQGDIDFGKLYKSGIHTVTIKAGFGANDPDPLFKSNVKKAIKAGMNVNLTVWVVPDQSAKAQAHFAAQMHAYMLKLHPKNDPQIFWDVEDASNGASMSRAAHVAELKAEMQQYKTETGEPISNGVLYTGGPYWNQFYDSAAFGPKGLNLNVDLANYNLRPPHPDFAHAPMPNGLAVNDIQWTSGAHLPGITQNTVDLDYVVTPMHGSVASAVG